jgi:uncharacterized protein (TIGR02231 family)
MLLFFLAVSVHTAFAQPRAFTSKVSEVTVYLQGAGIKRTAHITLEAGRNEIAFPGISNSIDPKSIRVQGTGNATILSVNYEDNYLHEQVPGVEEKRLQTELDTLQARLEHVQNEHESLTEEMEMMKANEKMSLSANSDYAGELETAADFYQKRMLDIKDRISKVFKQEKSLSEKIKKLTDQMSTIKNKNAEPGGQIVLVLLAGHSGTADIQFSYYANNAQWKPVYALRANKESDNIILEYNAAVSQTTGEDWKDVKLQLSTANPTVNGNTPELTSMVIQKFDPIYRYGRVYETVQIQMDPNDPYSTNDSTVSTPATEQDFSLSKFEANQNATYTSFNIAIPYSISPDGIEKTIAIRQDTMAGHFAYFAIPKLSSDVFLQARITNWEAYNLLPGEASIFLDNAYVAKSILAPTGTEDTLNVSFGVDDRINIKRKSIKNFSKRVGANRTDEYGYEISIRNTKTIPTSIRIEDQLPLSTNKEVLVTLKDGSGSNLEPVSGTLSWDLDLKPDEEKKVSFDYTVKHPRKMVLQNVH